MAQNDFNLVESVVNGKTKYELASYEHFTRTKEAIEEQSRKKITDKQTKSEMERHQRVLKDIQTEYDERLKALTKISDKQSKEYKDAKVLLQQSLKDRESAEKEFNKFVDNLNKQAEKEANARIKRQNDIEVKFAEQAYKKMSIFEKAEYNKTKLDRLKSKEDELKKQQEINNEYLRREQANASNAAKKISKLKTQISSTTDADELAKLKQKLTQQEALEKQHNEKVKELRKQDVSDELKKVSRAVRDTSTESNRVREQVQNAEARGQAASFDYLARNSTAAGRQGILKSLQSTIESDKDAKANELADIEKRLTSGLITEVEAVEARNEVEGKYNAVIKELSDEQSKLAEQVKKERKQRISEKAGKRQEQIGEDREAEKEASAVEAKAQWGYFLSGTGAKDNLGKSLAQSLENLSAGINNALNKIDATIDDFFKFQAKAESRLQGSTKSYQDALNMIQKNIGLNPYFTQKQAVENLKKLVESGVAYDLELRAFLMTVAEDVADTFNATDGTLLRLIRLQQADITASRLGMEATLTKFLNGMFEDTSYLANDISQSVSAAIIDANSQLTREQSAQFEYIVQKWLGSLYALGISESAVGTIAQGLNYLGTGNVEALNSNSSLNTLFAMSASRAGVPYADILRGGLDASTTNVLLQAMVEYLADIANNTENNQIVKSAYSNIFGISMSDLTAISNLSKSDISNIANSSLSYEQSLLELSNQFGQIGSRVHLSQMTQNLLENAITASSISMGSGGMYPMWLVTNLIEDLTGGIPIPAVSVMGNMVNLRQTVTGLVKAGMAGTSLMSSLLGSLFSGGITGTTDLTDWGFQELTSRGSGLQRISSGIASGSAQTSIIRRGNTSTSDITNANLSEASSEAEDTAKITNASVEGKDVYTLLENLLSLDRVFKTTVGTYVTDSSGEYVKDRKGNRIYASAVSTISSSLIEKAAFLTNSIEETGSSIFGATTRNEAPASSLNVRLTDISSEASNTLEALLKALILEAVKGAIASSVSDTGNGDSITSLLKTIINGGATISVKDENSDNIAESMRKLLFGL